MPQPLRFLRFGVKPRRVLSVPAFVRTLPLTPLQLILTPAFPPTRAVGFVTLMPFRVIRSRGLRMLMSLRFATSYF